MAGRIQKGERRVLNGKTVFADGNGNWTSGYSIFNLKAGGKKVGTYDTSVDPRRNDFAELNGERVVADGKGNWITPYSNRPGTTKGGQVRGSYGDAPSQPYKHNSDYTNKEVRDNKASVDSMYEKMKKEKPELFPKTPEENNNSSNRNNTRVIPGSGGQTQTGTDMGKIIMPGLDQASLEGIANFNGPSFPTQPESNKITAPFPNTGGMSENDQAILYAQSRGGLDGFKGSTTDEALLYAQGNGGLDGFKPGGKFSGAPTATDGQSANNGTGLQAALSDTASMRFKPSDKAEDPNKSGRYDDFGGSNPMSYAQSGEEMRRRAAFLDEPDSMKAVRNVAAGLGMGNQGLRNFANVDGKAVEMSSAQRREIMQAAPGEAQALKDKWVQALKTNNEDDSQVPSSAQNPTQASGTSTITVDKEIPLPGDAKGIDYLNNNDNDTGIAGRGGTSIPEAYNDDDERYSSFKPQDFYIK